MMASNAYKTFMASMQIDYEKWHDGIGYDLEALAAMTDAEKQQVLKLLRSRDDWRDVEALAALHNQRSGVAGHDAVAQELLESLEAMTGSKRGDTRCHALEHLHDARKISDDALEARILEELKIVEIGDGLTACFCLIDRVPTDLIRKRLLWCVLNRPRIGALFAGKLWQLCGKSGQDFDWSMRPLFLKFGEGNSPWVTYNAAQELCQLVGMKPEDAQ